MSSPSSAQPGVALPLLGTVSLYRTAVIGIVALAAAVALWNAYALPGHMGYDSEQNVHTAHDLVYEGQFGDPNDQNELSYKPPGFFYVAGSVYWLGDKVLHLTDPRSAVQFGQTLLVVATLLLTIGLARLVWPERRALHLLAGLFYVFMPLVLKTAGWFHPGTLSLFVSTLGLYLVTRMIALRRVTWPLTIALAVVVFGGLSVISANAWTYATVVLALVAAGVGRHVPWRRLALPLGALLGATLVVAVPFYVEQTRQHGDPFLSGDAPWFEYAADKPLTFYVGLGLPEVFTHPHRSNYVKQLVPMVYTESWGDYFGVWNWALGDPPTPPRGEELQQLRQQSYIGLLPSFVGIGAWLVLLWRWLVAVVRRQDGEEAALGPIVLLTLIAWAGFLYYAIGWFTTEGDNIKGTYMLNAVPAWALCFAWGVDRLRRLPVVGLPLLLVLGGSAVLSLPFLVYHSPLWGLL
jgi:hypothetical protein